jgi:hypothetical protein
MIKIMVILEIVETNMEKNHAGTMASPGIDKIRVQSKPAGSLQKEEI